ncbi:MAG TPA: AarF/UbiB family protein [Candidatus Sulfomarinibacteraceae bacterium]|nr:AarF/UbiB family protein [Candidatus Sulfomarinibacteraceae bacterium]
MSLHPQSGVAHPATPIDRTRYRRITTFFAGVILHLVWWDILLRRVVPGRVLASRSERWRTLSRRFRQLAVDMGGVLIKLGQFLSARVDVLPPEVTEELRGLQDEVPPERSEDILAVMAEELGDLEQRFSEIETEPVAAASLGQVHRAYLRPRTSDGEGAEHGLSVVVKVQRPGIERLVQTDLAALRVVARWMMRYPPIRRRADMPALLDEFARTLWEELDYRQEADNAERFAEMFADTEDVDIPFVYRRHSTDRVLVMEDVEAIKIIDLEGIEDAGISRREVAARLLDTYFLQIFEEGFFHADPHPGNLFIKPCDALPGVDEATSQPFCLIFVDFGMVGRIESLMGQNLRKVLLGVTQRDARVLTDAFRDLGFFLPAADLERIVEALDVLLDELWGRNLLELARPDPQEVQELTKEFRDILFDFPFQVPQDFVYLGRAMGILSGLSSTLDPELNPWYQVEKYGQSLLRRQEGRQIGWDVLVDTLKPLVNLPFQMERVMSAAEQGRLRVQAAPDREMTRRLDRLERKVTHLQLTLAAATGLLSGLLYYFMRDRDR